MRTLLVAAAPTPGLSAHVRQLAGSYEFVIGVDGGARVCADANVPVDLIVGDLDSLDLAALPASYSSVPTEIHPAEKDETDLELALRAARTHGATSITVAGAFWGRIDHTLASLGALTRVLDLVPEIAEPEFAAHILDPVNRSCVRVMTAESTFSVVGLAADTNVSVTGARWPLDHHTLPVLSGLGVSNAVSGDSAEVMVHQGIVLLVVWRERLG